MIDARLALLAFAAGCGTIQYYPNLTPAESTGSVTGSDGSDGVDGDDGDAPVETVGGESFVVDGVYPPYGTHIGGAEVVIEGGPFDVFTEVWLGDVSAEVLSSTEDELVVRVPAMEVGVVDVVVERDGAEARVADGFRVWEDASGLVGLAGTVAIVDVVGDYWAASVTDRAYAAFALVEPVRYESWEEFTPVFNTCAKDHTPPSLDLLDAGAASLVSASAEIDLESIDGWMESEGGVEAGQGYDLVAGEASDAWEAFTIDDMVRIPDGLRVTGPDLDSAAPLRVPRQFDMFWDAQSPGDYVAIVMEKTVYNANTQTYVLEETLSCAVADAGEFTVPGSLWADWDRDETIFVRIGRIRESTVALPYNNADVAVTGAYWISGALMAD